MEQPRHTHAVASPDAPPATPPEPPPQHADGAALAQSAALALGAPAAFVALDHGDGLRLVGTEGPMLPGDWLGALYAAAASHPGPLVVADLAGGAPDAPPSGAAAVALRAPDGTARGVLGVLMDGAGALTDARLQALDALARVAAETFGLAPPAEAVPTEGDGLLQSLRGFLPRLTVAHASERETALYRAFYEAILEQSPTDIIVVDHEGRYVHLSARKDRDDEMRAWLMGKTIIDYCARVGLDESIGRAVRDTEEEVVRTGRPHTLDLVLPGSTGPRHVARLAGPVHDRTGRVTHVVWHSVNVTERHLAETALARSEARYRALVDATGAAVWVAPASGEIVEEVPGWENITGQAADDQLGWGWLDAVHPDDRTRLGDAWQHAIETGAPFDATYRMRDRTSGYRDARTRAVRVAHADGGVEWVGMRVDVTAERAAERVLRESEERFRHLAESTPNGLVVTDADGRMTFVNREVERLFGYARGELVGQPVEALMPEADRRGHERLRAEYAADPSPRHLETGREVLGRRKDGSTFPIDVGLVPFEAGGGTGVLATIVDLTARRAAEEALRESEERLQTVIENLDEGLIIADLAGNVLHWNHAALTLHGFTSVEEGQRALPEFQDIFELLTPEGAVVPYDEWPMPRIFRGEALSGLVLRLRRVDTDWERTFRYGGTTALDAGGRPVIFLTVTDVTEQCAAEAALLARMAELQAITDHADDLILRFDRDLRY
ncbi:MAG TPA: PAS domain S-box protein, partial [Rhodothermales bacterium]|nr:PAS domain S-box protein [Rhodothermales bacterium]